MVRIGNFLFRFRNGLFPLAYALLLLGGRPVLPDWRIATAIGLLVATTGQTLRAATIGLDYIVRGGRDRQVFAKRLVVGGLFAHCRNPLYLGNFLILLGVGLASNSLWFLGIAIPFFAFAYATLIAAEEAYLQNMFGTEFDDYCARVNRLIPNLRGIRNTFASIPFNWRRLVTAEYGTTYIWLAAFILLTLRNATTATSHDAQRHVVWSLWILLAIATAAYAAARYLKKSGLLKAGASSPHSSH